MTGSYIRCKTVCRWAHDRHSFQQTAFSALTRERPCSKRGCKSESIHNAYLQAWLLAILLSMTSHYNGRAVLINRVPTQCLGCKPACDKALHLQTSIMPLQYYVWLQLSTDISAQVVQLHHRHMCCKVVLLPCHRQVH